MYTPGIRMLLVIAAFSAVLIAPRTAQLTPEASEVVCGNWALATSSASVDATPESGDVTLWSIDGTEILSASFAQPDFVVPVDDRGHALVGSRGGDYSVLDVESGTIEPIQFPGTAQGTVRHDVFMFLLSEGRRYQLFASFAGAEGHLVDIESQDVTPLTQLTGGENVVLSGAVSANDSWLVFNDGAANHLFELTDSGPALVSHVELPVGAARFTPDSRYLVSIRPTDDGQREIVARTLATGDETIIASSGEWQDIQVLDDQIAIGSGEDGLYRLFIDGSAPERVLESGDPVYPFTFDERSRTLLAQRFGPNESTEWLLLALDSLEVIELPELTDMSPLTLDREASWATFSTARTAEEGSPGTPYLSLDLLTGDIGEALVQDSDDYYFSGYSSSADSRYEIVHSINNDRSRVWLIDNASASAELIGESSNVMIGLVTEDGCFAAAGNPGPPTEDGQNRVSIIDLRSGEEASSIEDVRVLGWVQLPR